MVIPDPAPLGCGDFGHGGCHRVGQTGAVSGRQQDPAGRHELSPAWSEYDQRLHPTTDWYQPYQVPNQHERLLRCEPGTSREVLLVCYPNGDEMG